MQDKSIEELKSRIKELEGQLSSQQLKFDKERNHLKKLGVYSQQTPHAIINWNLNFQVTFWNEAAENLFGFSREEAIGKKAKELIIPENEKKHIDKIWQKLIENKGGTHSSNSNLTKSGDIIFCEWYNTPLLNEDGNVNSVTSLVLDMTHSQRAENKLIESENRFKVLSNASFEGIFILDKGVCVEANETGCQLFGYPYHEIIGMHALNVIAPEDRKTVGDNIISGYSEPYEVTGLRKDGSTFPAEIQGKNLKYKGEEVRITAVRNISKRKQAQLELRESEGKFKSIFEHSGDGILIGNNQGFIVEANASFCKMTGYAHDELISNHIKNMFSKETLEKYPLRFDLLDEGKTIIVEREIIGKKKEPILIEMNSKRLDDNYLIASFRDLTERQKAEQTIRESNKQLKLAKEKAEYSDKLKSEFLANMSHEIRTPMNGIMGFSDMLNDPELEVDKRNYYTSIIINSSNQLKRIIDDILEISELETKQIKVVNTEVCINNLLLELFSIYDSKAKDNKTPIYISKPLNDIESTILTDEVKLRKILNNLIDNALHYTSEGHIEVGYKLKDNVLEFHVKDTGIGIKDEMQHLIFERFSQEDKSLSRRYGGLGLGLSIAKENSELLGGSIFVDSKKGEGSTFYFTIPYIQSKEIKTSIVSQKNKNNRIAEFTLLIAEDEEVNYLYLETLLKRLKNNFNIIRAKTGKEAVEEFHRNNTIDLILMDIKMPVMDGLEATKEIRKTNSNIPIIAQTAYSRLDDKNEAIAAGCNDFFSKPINRNVFLETLNLYLDLNNDFFSEI